MPFWKQSDDPWDRKPETPRPEPKASRENPMDSLKQWNEDRKAAAKEREDAKRLPPEPCPWCGKDMEQGYLITGRDPIRWHPGIYKFTLFSGLAGDAMRIDTEGTFTMYRTAWLCRECGKMVLDIPEKERVYDAPEDEDDKPSEMTQKEETSGE